MPYRHGRCAILDLCERYDTDPSSFRLKFRRDVPAQACQTDVFAEGTQEFFRLRQYDCSFFAMSASVIWHHESDNTY